MITKNHKFFTSNYYIYNVPAKTTHWMLFWTFTFWARSIPIVHVTCVSPFLLFIFYTLFSSYDLRCHHFNIHCYLLLASSIQLSSFCAKRQLSRFPLITIVAAFFIVGKLGMCRCCWWFSWVFFFGILFLCASAFFGFYV